MKKFLLLVGTFAMSLLNPCDNTDVIEEPVTSEVDFQLIEGEYIETLRSNVTSFTMSAKVIKGSADFYNVELFETSNFKPSHNSDGVTPEVIGTFRTMGNIIEAKLILV